MAATSYHEPVLLHEAVGSLITGKQGTYVDGTLGGGGHAGQILASLGSDAELFGIDHDREALDVAIEAIGDDARFTAIRGNYGHMEQLLPQHARGRIDGILLDLGVSSHQIDDPERGFMFREEARLDMRMSSLFATTAYDVVNYYSENELKRIFKTYGEERHAGKIASAVAANRPVSTTSQLREVIAEVTSSLHRNKTLARIFQALRIEVNRELEMLERFFTIAPDLMAAGGRLVVISYHSLEDRLAKNFMRSGNASGKMEKDFYGNPVRPWNPVNNKPVRPDETEIQKNPRARSAKMRVAERVESAA